MKQTTSIVLLFLGACIFTGCARKEDTNATNPSKRSDILTLSSSSIKEIDLAVLELSRVPVRGHLTLSAHVVANQDSEARVGSLVPGRVQKVFVRVGDKVKQGETVMTIEGLDVGAIKAGYLKAKAAYAYAQSALDRQKKLFEQNAGSQKALLETQAECEKALAEFRAEDKRIHSVGLTDELAINAANDEHTPGTLPIRSPINGIVAERNVVIGQFVDATSTAFTILNTRSVWVDAQAYERDLPRIAGSGPVAFEVEARPDHRYMGKIIFVGSTVDERTRTTTVRAEFRNPDLSLKPHMFGELVIPISSSGEGFVIPRESVVKEGGKEFVFVQRSDTTFECRDVVAGAMADNGIEIVSGLQVGERVVTRGTFYLRSELKKEEIKGDED
jgi:membrane fusion protein, heavy metal efflux system